MSTGSTVCLPGPHPAPCGWIARQGRQVCERTGRELEHVLYPVGTRSILRVDVSLSYILVNATY